MKNHNDIIGVELFSGAGGMAQGAKYAGIKTVVAIENDVPSATTYLSNHPKTTVIIDKVQNVHSFNLGNSKPIVLFGGPPCQGYSKSNSKTWNKTNEKNWLFKEFIRVSKILKPDWIVIENVPGLIKLDKGFFIKEICKSLHEEGYIPNFQILNAVNYGVPQVRDRLFIVASKNGMVYKFPESKLEKLVTVKDAISDLPILKNGDRIEEKKYKQDAKSDYAKSLRKKRSKVTQNYVTRNSLMVLERYKHIKQGNNWKDIPPELMGNYTDHSRCHGNIYRRLHYNKPSIIIANYRKSMIIHPTQNRGLSVREAARIQSFPDKYDFLGSLDQRQQQVGNAVPPILAKAIFTQLKN